MLIIILAVRQFALAYMAVIVSTMTSLLILAIYVIHIIFPYLSHSCLLPRPFNLLSFLRILVIHPVHLLFLLFLFYTHFLIGQRRKRGLVRYVGLLRTAKTGGVDSARCWGAHIAKDCSTSLAYEFLRKIGRLAASLGNIAYRRRPYPQNGFVHFAYN